MFSIPTSGGTPTALASFDGDNGDYLRAGVTLSADGSTLYGATVGGGAYGRGTVFSVPSSGGTPTVLASISGSSSSSGGVTLSADICTLYGTTTLGGTYGDGTIFSVPATGGTPTVLANFNGANGQCPYDTLTLSADGSTLYGTTAIGGAYGDGEIFKISVDGGTPTVLASFNGTNGEAPTPA